MKTPWPESKACSERRVGRQNIGITNTSTSLVSQGYKCGPISTDEGCAGMTERLCDSPCLEKHEHPFEWEMQSRTSTWSRAHFALGRLEPLRGNPDTTTKLRGQGHQVGLKWQNSMIDQWVDYQSVKHWGRSRVGEFGCAMSRPRSALRAISKALWGGRRRVEPIFPY